MTLCFPNLPRLFPFPAVSYPSPSPSLPSFFPSPPPTYFALLLPPSLLFSFFLHRQQTGGEEEEDGGGGREKARESRGELSEKGRWRRSSRNVIAAGVRKGMRCGVREGESQEGAETKIKLLYFCGREGRS